MKVLFAFLLVLLAGCSTPPATDGEWMLVYATDSTGSFDAPTVSLTVSGSEFSGTAPCNSYAGTFFDGFTTTELACDELDLEQRYYAALGAVHDAAVTGGMLSLAGDNVVLRFERA